MDLQSGAWTRNLTWYMVGLSTTEQLLTVYDTRLISAQSCSERESGPVDRLSFQIWLNVTNMTVRSILKPTRLWTLRINRGPHCKYYSRPFYCSLWSRILRTELRWLNLPWRAGYFSNGMWFEPSHAISNGIWLSALNEPSYSVTPRHQAPVWLGIDGTRFKRCLSL